MARRIFTGIVVLMLYGLVSLALADFDSALSAYNREDYQSAWQEFTALADQGDDRAYFYLGFMLANGLGVDQDYLKALDWYRRAAEVAGSGDVFAMNNIGVMYEFGQGVAQDYQQALSWYGRAALAGYPQAMRNVADLYSDGHGVEQNDQLALAWMQSAALRGDGSAQNDLGYMIGSGLGTQADVVEAFAWYLVASINGNETGTNNVQAVRSRLSDEEVASSLVRAAEIMRDIAAGKAPELPELPGASTPNPIAGGTIPGFTGTFANETLSVELQESGGEVSGRILFGGQTFPLTAQASGSELNGTFSNQGNDFTFTATLEGNTLTLETGGVSYQLMRRADPPQ